MEVVYCWERRFKIIIKFHFCTYSAAEQQARIGGTQSSPGMPCWPDESSSFRSQVSALHRKSQVVVSNRKGSPRRPAPQYWLKCFPLSSVQLCTPAWEHPQCAQPLRLRGGRARPCRGGGGEGGGGESPMSCPWSRIWCEWTVDKGRFWAIGHLVKTLHSHSLLKQNVAYSPPNVEKGGVSSHTF